MPARSMIFFLYLMIDKCFNLTYRYTDMIMGLRGHNAKHYCNYCNICGCSNCKHIYCPLQSPKNLASSSGPKRNYSANDLPLRSHKDDYETAVYLSNHADLEFSQSTGIKYFTLFWNLPSLEWPWYDFLMLAKKNYVVLTDFFRSYPIDNMHLFYLNITPQMCRHWQWLFFYSNDDDSSSNQYTMGSISCREKYSISPQYWKKIDSDLARSANLLPGPLGEQVRLVKDLKKATIENLGEFTFSYFVKSTIT